MTLFLIQRVSDRPACPKVSGGCLLTRPQPQPYGDANRPSEDVLTAVQTKRRQRMSNNSFGDNGPD